MKQKFISILTILIVTTLSACGPAPTPTMSAADIQGTAIANAWAAVTLTQAAMPTPTSTSTPTAIPPTETPVPTIMVFPTIPLLQPAVTASNPATDPCNDVAPSEPNGATVKVKFVNKSDAPLDLHFGMNSSNALGECGIYYFPLGRYEQPVVTVLAGCYWAYAYIHGNQETNAKNVETLCVTDPTRTPAIWIGKETIGFH